MTQTDHSYSTLANASVLVAYYQGREGAGQNLGLVISSR